MKSLTKPVVVALCLVFVASLALAGCGNDYTAEDLVGAWANPIAGVELTLQADGAASLTVEDQELQGTYTVDGDKIVFAGETGESTKIKYRFDDEGDLIVGADLIPGEEVILVRQ